MEKESKKTGTIVELKRFSFAYGSSQVFDKADLHIAEGQTYGIVGDNGAGKTTLFNIISGDLHADSANQLLPSPVDVAFLQASPYFYPYMTGLEYLRVIGQHSGAKASEWNALFGLPLKEYIHNYSTGMQKKLAVMGALLLEKKIVIMDEPFNGLDLKTSETVNIIIERLKQTGHTVLLASHILETILRHADEVVLLRDGRLSPGFKKPRFGELAKIIRGEFVGGVREEVGRLIL